MNAIVNEHNWQQKAHENNIGIQQANVSSQLAE
jgi:hypothetical protein